MVVGIFYPFSFIFGIATTFLYHQACQCLFVFGWLTSLPCYILYIVGISLTLFYELLEWILHPNQHLSDCCCPKTLFNNVYEQTRYVLLSADEEDAYWWDSLNVSTVLEVLYINCLFMMFHIYSKPSLQMV